MSSTAVGAVLGSLVGGLVIGALLRCPTREKMGNNFFSNEKILVTDADGNLVVKSINELKQYIDGKTGANTNLITGAGGVNQRIGNIDGRINGVNQRIDDSKTRLETIETVMPEVELMTGMADSMWEGRLHGDKVPLPHKNGYSPSLGEVKGIPWNIVHDRMTWNHRNHHDMRNRVFTYQDIVSACIDLTSGEKIHNTSGHDFRKAKYLGIRKTQLLNNSYARNHPEPCWYQEGDPNKKQGGKTVTSWEQANWMPEHDGTVVTYKLH